MDFRTIRQTFLDYFRRQGHEIVPSSSLVPRDDPTLLFTNAGMVQFKRMFLGEEKRGFTRAASVQKCMRAGGKHNDLDNVGYTARHHTFFEMLGNFSFGDYFKQEAIVWAWDLLTQGYGLSPERLSVSVFQEDDEAHKIWEHEVGVPPERIIRLGEKDNFWAMGDTGPCGPCSEIYMDQGPAMGCGRDGCGPGCDCDRYLEIWNLVFTQFDRRPDGTLEPLPRPNIDTGMGLERLAAVVQGVSSNYDTDLFQSIIGRIEALAETPYRKEAKKDVAFRVIADHSRAIAFLIGDGVIPSNEGRGYVLRRIIRRAIRFGQVLGLEDPFLHEVCTQVLDLMGEEYEELQRARSLIQGVVLNEERRFADTLHASMRVLEEEIARLRQCRETTLRGEVAFRLYDTYGLSPDIVMDVAREEGLSVDLDGYEREMARQRAKSQQAWKGSGEEEIPEAYRGLLAKGFACRFTGYDTLVGTATVVALVREGREVELLEEGDGEVVLSETPFYGESGGQVGDTGWISGKGARFEVTETVRVGHELIIHKGRMEVGVFRLGDEVEARVEEARRKATARNHSATHLLHAALREVLGDHVKQAGSMVAPDRLRFDFSHFTQVPQERLKEIEGIVNHHIRENYPVVVTEMDRQEAMKTGAMAIFEERYGERVRLVRMGEGISLELCGGTHTQRTGDIGLFRIVGEGAVAANVRRIEALTGEAALLHDQAQEAVLREAARLLKAAPEEVPDRVGRILGELKDREREVEGLKARLRAKDSEALLEGVRLVGGVRVLARRVEVKDPKELREYGDQLRNKLGSGIVLLGAKAGAKAMLLCLVSPELQDRFKAGEIIRELSGLVGGKGGGRPDMAQGGGTRPEGLDKALEAVYALVEKGGEEPPPPG